MLFLSKTNNREKENNIIACVLDNENISILKKFREEVIKIEGLISAKRTLDKIMLLDSRDRDLYIKDTHVSNITGCEDPLEYYEHMLDNELIPTQDFWDDLEFYKKSRETFVSWQKDAFYFEVVVHGPEETKTFSTRYLLNTYSIIRRMVDP